ncbi:MAG: hypothetical protein QM736_17170 [Vicinamibacterales bacterium]
MTISLRLRLVVFLLFAWAVAGRVDASSITLSFNGTVDRTVDGGSPTTPFSGSVTWIPLCRT